MSVNVFDPIAMNELLPDQSSASADNHWAKDLFETQDSYATPVQSDKFLVSSEKGSMQIPNILLPPQLHKDGNYIKSYGSRAKPMKRGEYGQKDLPSIRFTAKASLRILLIKGV